MKDRFDKLVEMIETGDEYDAIDHQNGSSSVWFTDGRRNYKVSWSDRTGQPFAVQRVGTMRVFWKSENV